MKTYAKTKTASVAGFTFLFYIAAGLISMGLSDVRISVVLGLTTCFAALVLAVTLYWITRDEDPVLALLALTCRVSEGAFGAIGILTTLGVFFLGTAAGEGAPDTAAVHLLSALLLKMQGWNITIDASFFAVGSTLFSYLLLRGRTIPVPLAYLGVGASVLLVVGLPLQLAGFISGPDTMLMSLPILLFEVPLGLWLLIKGIAMPTPNVALPRADQVP